MNPLMKIRYREFDHEHFCHTDPYHKKYSSLLYIHLIKQGLSEIFVFVFSIEVCLKGQLFVLKVI